MNRTLKRFLVHKCTYTDVDSVPVLDGFGQPTYDELGDPIMENATPVTDISCLFAYEDILSTTEEGQSLLHTPILYLPTTQSVRSGSLISNVISRDSSVLYVRGIIETIDLVSEFGVSIIKKLGLSGVTTVRR